MATFAHAPKAQFFDSNGDPLSGGKVYTYEVGTTTNKATYPTVADAEAATNANANPIILDSRGETTIVVTGITKFRVDDSADNNIYTVDNVRYESDTVFDSNGNEILKYNETASATTYLEITNQSTGVNPQVSSEGEATIGLDFHDSNENELLTLESTASAVNAIEIKNQSTGVAPEVNADGEANIGMEFNDSNDNELLQLTSVASAVNQAVITNAITAVPPTVSSAGEADIGLVFKDSNGAELFSMASVGTAVNYIEITNSATGNAVILSALGGDTNIDIMVQPKGTGIVGVKGTATSSAEVRLFEDTDNGTNYLGFKAPAALTASTTFTLPDGDGTNTQVLQTNGSGVLSWVNN